MLIHAESSHPTYILPSPSKYLICPMCHECFPQISAVRIKEETLQVSLLCQRLEAKDFAFTELLELLEPSNTPLPSKTECCLRSYRSSSKHTDNTKYCIICNEWFCDHCRQHHDELVFHERSELTETYTDDGVNHLFLDRKIDYTATCCKDNGREEAQSYKCLVQRDMQQTKEMHRQYHETTKSYYCEGCKIDETREAKANDNWVDVGKEINELLPIRNETELKQNETKFLSDLNVFVTQYVNEHKDSTGDHKQIQIIQNAFELSKTIHEHYHELYKYVNNNFRLMLYVNVYNHNIVQSMKQVNKLQHHHNQMQAANDSDHKQQYNYNFYDLQRILKTNFYYNISELDATFCFSFHQHHVHSLFLYGSILLSIGTKLRQSHYPYFNQTNIAIGTKTPIKGLCILQDKTIILYEQDKFIHFKPKTSHTEPFDKWLCEKYDHNYSIWAVKEYSLPTKHKEEPLLLVADEKYIRIISTLKWKDQSKRLYKYKHNFNAITQHNISVHINTLLQLQDKHFAYGNYGMISVLSISEKDFRFDIKCKNTHISNSDSNGNTDDDGSCDFVSSLVKVNGVDLYACACYNGSVGVWNFSGNDKSFYHEIGRYVYGIVDIVSRKKKELITLSADGTCHVWMIGINGVHLEWSLIFTFHTKMHGGISLISMKESENDYSNITENIVICANDQIEMWYVNTGIDSFNAPRLKIERAPYEKK